MSDKRWMCRRPWLGIEPRVSGKMNCRTVFDPEAHTRRGSGVILLAALMTLALITGLHADEIKLSEPISLAGATKTLHFPPNQRVGWLLVEPESGPVWDPKLVRLRVGDDSWALTAVARGDVVLPAGRNIELRVVLAPGPQDIAKMPARKVQRSVTDRLHPMPRDLSGLEGLDANDLCHLRISSVTKRTDTDRLLEPIRRLTGLQMLSLNRTGLTDKGMQHIRELRSLRALELDREHRVGNAGLAVLKELPALEYLALGTGVTDVGLKTVGQLKNLRWLRVSTGNIWGPGLAELANLPHLERLCIHGSGPFSDRHVRYLEGLTHLKSLTFWSVGSALTDASLASIGKLKNLEALHFVGTSPSFTAAGVAQLEGLKQLKRIDFAHSRLGGTRGREDETVRRLTAALPHLESLQIGRVTAQGMKALGTLRNLKRLDVGLKDHKSGYRGPTGVSYLAGLTSLEDLHLEGGRALSDQDLIHLESLTNLKDLHIAARNVTDRGLATIGKLRQLESLSLMRSRVTGGGLSQLGGLTNLRSLDVRLSLQARRSAVRGELTMDLSGMKNLRRLFLFGFSLQDADLACLASLRSLENISIQGGYSQPSSFPAVSLRHLKGLPELDRLYISGLSGTRAEDFSVLGSLPGLGKLTLAGSIPDAALRGLGNLRSGWSLTVKTDKFIRAETIADLKQRLSATEYEYVHIQALPKPQPRTIQPRQRRGAPKPPRANQQRRQRQNRRR